MVDILTRHFLRRFVDNDLLSPDADQHEVTVLVGAGLATFSLFVTFGYAMKYLIGFALPGPMALTALDDKFLYIAGSMSLTALVTVKYLRKHEAKAGQELL